MEKQKKIESLQSLRGIFAFLIFLSHALMVNGGNPFSAGGDIGVAFFFVLSGFVLCQAHEQKAEAAGAEFSGQIGMPYGRFMLKRVVRIYPLHLLCWLWCVAIGIRYYRSFDLPIDLANLFLLQSWIPIPEYYYSVNAASWCLSDFIFFYLLFPVLLKWVVRQGKSFIATLAVLTITWCVASGFMPDAERPWAVYIWPVSRLLDFAAGMVLWQLTSRRRSSGSTTETKANLRQFAALLLCLGSFAALPLFDTDLTQSIFWWPAVLLTVAVFVRTGHTGLLGRLLSWRPFVAFGNVSFGFYLIHIPVINLSVLFLRRLIPEGGAEFLAAVLALSLAVSIAGSFLLARYYERPISRLILRRPPK